MNKFRFRKVSFLSQKGAQHPLFSEIIYFVMCNEEYIDRKNFYLKGLAFES